MGIDYIVDLACAAKEQLSTEGIVELVKARSRANAVVGVARERGDQRPEREITFDVGVMRQGKVERQSVSVGELLDKAAALDEHAGGCAACPANRGQAGGYGCYRSIGYPIAAETERLLLSKLPARLESGAGFMFSAAMRDFAWDGAQAADMRSQGDTFFELRTAPRRSWPSGLSITGDQLFHMMFQVGHIGDSHAKMLCLFLGLLPVGDETPAEVAARKAPLELASANARAMIELVNTLAFAASEELEILIDA